jgi:hypothetical protein
MKQPKEASPANQKPKTITIVTGITDITIHIHTPITVGTDIGLKLTF